MIPASLRVKKIKICIVCEGYEEADYLTRLKELDVWNDKYDFEIANAKSEGYVPALYKEKFQSDSYDLVLAMYDTDKPPYKVFSTVITKIDELHGQDTWKNVSIFSNPCSMQIQLSHFGDVSLKTSGKKTNAQKVEELTEISDYDAKIEQRDKINKQITKENYLDMKTRIKNILQDYTNNPSTNFYEFLVYFEDSCSNWIDVINKKINNN
ncbi:MAG: hypothetical protein U0K92_06450 [Treponema sp.]|nr:hypothetical protein [Treponema sp.]